MNSHLTEEATLLPTAPVCEGHEDSWGHRAAAGVSKSRQLGQGCLMASQLSKQTAVQVPPSFQHGSKSNASIFIEHYTKWKSFNLGNALETVHFLTYVTNCWSPTKACSTQQIRFWFFAFWDCGLIKTIHKTEKKNECNILKGEKKKKKKKRRDRTILYEPAVWQIQFHIQRERVSSYMATYCKLPYSRFCFATF